MASDSLNQGQSLYYSAHQSPENLINTIKLSDTGIKTPKHPSYGVDSPTGLLAAGATRPLYLYATKRGKFIIWDRLLAEVPDSFFYKPSLDLGCGRGSVLLKVATRKKEIANSPDALPGMRVEPVFGMDIFSTHDQSGNAAIATYKNAASLDVVDFTVLHEASFAETFPFADGVFSLITACLALHNTDKAGRSNAVREISRVCAPGGRLIIVDIFPYVKSYQTMLEEEGWQDVKVKGAGPRMIFGVLPCKILKATKE